MIAAQPARTTGRNEKRWCCTFPPLIWRGKSISPCLVRTIAHAAGNSLPQVAEWRYALPPVMKALPTHTLAVLALFCLLATPHLARAQHETGADVFSGELAYQSYCANCHGAAGNQVANVDIGRGVFRRPYSDEDLAGIVMRGIPGTPMPATPNMSREQANQIVGYLRSRAQAKEVAAGGDATRGRALFAGDGQCFTCHRVQGEGSRRGPDLSRIGTLRTADHLARSLLDPDAEVQPGNRTYRVDMRNGLEVTGRLLNQDAYSVQLLTGDEELRSFQKADLKRHGFVPSPMPSMRGKWNDQQLADVVSYLVSLRGSAKP
jgi:putative heme-binding domain-containing protein